MDLILAALVLLVLAAPIGLAGGWMTSGGATGIARAFLPAPPMEWPHGVQEEDEVHWDWAAKTESAPTDDDHPPMAWIEELLSGDGPPPARIDRG